MRTNYVYGQPSLLIKQCVMNSWAEHTNKQNIDPKEWIKKEQKKLKDCWIENFYFGFSDNRLILERVTNFNKINHHMIDLAVKKIVMSCYITYRTVKDKLNYAIDEPEVCKIKYDILNCVLNPVLTANVNSKVKTSVTTYIATFNKMYVKLINSCKEEVNNGWNNGPSDEIKRLFTKSYTYGHRRTDNRKWNWLKNIENDELVNRIIDEHMYTINAKNHIEFSSDFNRMLKEYKSVKEIKNLVNDQLSKLSPEELHVKKIKCEVNKWWNNMDESTKVNCGNIIKNSKNYDVNSYCILMINVYKYNKDWMVDNKFKFTKEIKSFIDDMK